MPTTELTDAEINARLAELLGHYDMPLTNEDIPDYCGSLSTAWIAVECIATPPKNRYTDTVPPNAQWMFWWERDGWHLWAMPEKEAAQTIARAVLTILESCGDAAPRQPAQSALRTLEEAKCGQYPWIPCADHLPPPGKLCHVRRGKIRLHDARLVDGRWIYEADDESGRQSSGDVDGAEWRLVEGGNHDR